MNKTLAAGVLVVALLAGITLGGTMFHASGPSEEELARAHELEQRLSDTDRKYRELRARHEKLSGNYRSLDAEHRQLKTSFDAQQVALEAKADAGAAAADGETGTISAVDEIADKQLDWAKVEKLVSENIDVLERMSDMIRDQRQPTSLSREDQAIFHEIVLEWNKLASEARLVSDYPMLDGDILPQVLSSFFSSTLGLDPGQVDALNEEALALLEKYPLPEGATPLEAFESRSRVMRDLLGFLDGHVDEDQADGWNAIRNLWQHVSIGNRRDVSLGVESTSTATQLASEWRDHYQLTPDQQRQVEDLAQRYVEQGERILGRYGQAGASTTSLDPRVAAELDRAFRDLQLEMEERLVPLLGEDQLSELPGRIPVLIRFREGRGSSTSTEDDLGF